MKKSLIAYFFVFAFILSSCSSQKVATSSSNSTYPTTSGHKKFTPGQESETGEASRLEDLKSRMAILEAQLDAIKSGESSKSKKATEKEVAAVNKEIEKVKKEEVAANSNTPKNGQRKFVPKTKSKEEIAAAKAKAKKPAKAKESPVEKTKVAANTSKPKAPKKPAEKTKPKTDTKTASVTPKKPAPKPAKPAAPPKPKIVYKTISEKVLGNYFMDGSTSSQNMFCLHKTAPVGTQVKVINPMNGKSLTLKVLGKIPNLAEDMGVAIKITYSAARQLNLRDQRFELKCTYKMPFTIDPITGASASVH
ncbi:MAG: hypothetical protein AB8B69_18420 [Chitinophagales bacterium]